MESGQLNGKYFSLNFFHLIFNSTTCMIEKTFINIFKEIYLSMKLQKNK